MPSYTDPLKKQRQLIKGWTDGLPAARLPRPTAQLTAGGDGAIDGTLVRTSTPASGDGERYWLYTPSAEALLRGGTDEVIINCASCSPKQRKLQVVIEPLKPQMCSAADGISTGNPIVPASGEKVQTVVDYADGGVDALHVRRHYSSISRQLPHSSIPVQHKAWRFDWDSTLEEVREITGKSAPGAIAPPSGTVTPTPNGAAARIYWIDQDFDEANLSVHARPTVDLVFRLAGRSIRFSKLPKYTGMPAYNVKKRSVDGNYTLSNSAHNSHWTVTSKRTGMQWLTDRRGVLQSITRGNGWKTTYTSNRQGQITRITSHFGRQLNLSYNTAGEVDSITQPDGGVIRYGYTAVAHAGKTHQLLTSVVYPDGKSRLYHYEDSSHPLHLTGISDESGTRLSTYRYDAQGRAISSERAGGVQKYSVDYSRQGQSGAVVTDPLGKQRAYKYSTAGGKLHVTHSLYPGAQGQTTRTRVPNPDGTLKSTTDFRGTQTSYQYNSRQLPTRITEAANRTAEKRATVIEWHPTLALPIKTTLGSRQTTYRYDARGNLLNRTSQDTAKPNAPKDSITYTYYPTGAHAGLVKTLTTPQSGTTRYTYDARGFVQSSTNALGHIIRYRHDAAGRVTAITDPNGIQTRYTYDARGRLTTRSLVAADSSPTSPNIETDRYSYTPWGKLQTATYASGYRLTLRYDAAHRPTGYTDNQGRTVTFKHDSMGNLTQLKAVMKQSGVPDDRYVYNWLYDQNNRLQKQYLGDGQHTTQYREHSYNNNGQWSMTQRRKDRGQSFAFTETLLYRDHLNRPTRNHNAHGLSQYTWDAYDNLVTATDGISVKTTYSSDALGNTSREHSADKGSTIRIHNARGLLAHHIDQLGNLNSYHYDALGRHTLHNMRDNTATQPYPAGVSQPDSQYIHHQYDRGAYAKGRITQTTTPNSTTRYAYNSMGRLKSKTTTYNSNGQSFTIAYTYRAGGQIATESYSGNATWPITFVNQYDATGRMIGQKVNEQQYLQSIHYGALGQPIRWWWGNGHPEWRRYTNGQLRQNGAGVYSYDDHGRLHTIAHHLLAPNAAGTGSAYQWASYSIDYDRADRLHIFRRNAWRLNGSQGPITQYYHLFGHNNNDNRSSASYRFTGSRLAGSSTAGSNRSVLFRHTSRTDGGSMDKQPDNTTDSSWFSLSDLYDMLGLDSHTGKPRQKSQATANKAQPGNLTAILQSNQRGTAARPQDAVAGDPTAASRAALARLKAKKTNTRHSRAGGNPLQPNTANTTSTRTSTANRTANTTPGYTTSNYDISTRYQYQTNTNRQSRINLNRNGQHSSHSNTCDAAGNLLTTITKDGQTRTLYYDEAGRVARVKLGTQNSSAPSVYNYYNEDGQRIFRTEPISDAQFKAASPTGKLTSQLPGLNFYYNAQNKLVYQNGTGTSNRHSQAAYYFWLGDIPVGVMSGQGVFNIYADHLNTPRGLMDWNATWGKPDAQMAWQWHYSPFGENLPTTDANFYREEYADELKFPATASNPKAKNPVLDLRYPGQFYDASTGLHQNWMRMYDPQTARYTRPDPIGLSGGMNRYVYAGGNALWAVDERGEATAVLPVVGGGMLACLRIPMCRAAAAKAAQEAAKAMSGAKPVNEIYNEVAEDEQENAQEEVAEEEDECPPEDLYMPDRELPKDEHGHKVPDSDNAHTQIGKKRSKRTGKEYRQTREWGAKGDRGYDGRTPKKDTDWTDHRRPDVHDSPHDHPYNPSTGKRL